MILAEVDVGEEYRHICDLNIHKAMGVDKISTKFIKASPNGMAMLLTKLINKSITSFTFPDTWENAVVIHSSLIRVPHCLIFIQSLFYLFFLNS